MNGTERPLPERGPLFESNPRLREAMDRLLADHPPGEAAWTTETDPRAQQPEGRPDRRVGRFAGVGVFRLDLPGLTPIVRALGNASAERMVRHIENVLAGTLRAEDRILRIGGTAELIIIAGVAGEADDPVTRRAIADRLRAALAATGERAEPAVTWVPRARDDGGTRIAER